MAVLLARLRPFAVIVACAVMTVDVSANYYVNWPQISQHPDYLLRPLGLLPFTLFALFVAVTASPLYRHLARIAGARKPIGDNAGWCSPSHAHREQQHLVWQRTPQVPREEGTTVATGRGR